MKHHDTGNFFYIANPVVVHSVKDTLNALRDCLDEDEVDVREILEKFQSRIREVKSHG